MVVVLGRVICGRWVVTLFGPLGKLLHGVDTTSGENGSLDNPHIEEKRKMYWSCERSKVIREQGLER